MTIFVGILVFLKNFIKCNDDLVFFLPFKIISVDGW